MPAPRRPACHPSLAGLGLFMLFLLPVPVILADTIILRSGEKLLGRIVSEEPDKVTFESQGLGPLVIARDRIDRLEHETPVAPPPAAPVAVATATPSNQFIPWMDEGVEDTKFDWIQLKTGEWLKGRIKSMQDEKLEFDSEKLNLLSFDWEDIKSVRTPQQTSVLFDMGEQLNGPLLIAAGEVQVDTPTGKRSYPRAALLAITPTGDKERDKWSAKLTAGVSLSSGNSRSSDINVRAELQRRTPNTRLFFDYAANYGSLDGGQTENNQRVITQFDYFLSRRLYVRVPDIEYYRDPLQNLAHRITLGAGVGYDLVKNTRTEWNVTFSPSWQRNYYESVEPGADPSPQALALVFSSRFDTELTQRLELILEYRGQLTRQENGNDTHHAVSTLEFEIHKRLKLNLSLTWDRISKPSTNAEMEQPTPDDLKLITSLTIDY